MLDPAKTQHELYDLAGQLPKVKDPNSQHLINGPHADRLEDVADAVGGGPNRFQWAEVDVLRAFDPALIASLIVKGEKPRDRSAVLDWFRSALILCPVLLTWFGIFLAMRGYAGIVQDQQLAQEPFLYLWQSGALHVPLTFGDIAFLDCILIGLVIVLTMRIHRRSRDESIHDYQVEHQRAFVTRVLADASFWLAAAKGGQAAQFAKEASDFLLQLDKERQRLADLGERRERELEQLTAFAKDLKEGASALVEAALKLEPLKLLPQAITDLTTSNTKIIECQEKMQTSLELLSTQQQQLLMEQRKQLGDLVGELNRLVEQVERSGEILAQRVSSIFDQTMDQLRRDNEAVLREMQRSHREILDRIEQMFRVIAADLGNAAGILTAAAVSLQRSADRLVDAVDSLGKIVGTMENRVERAEQHYDDLLKTTQELLKAIQDQREEQAKLTEGTVRVATSIEKALNSLQNASNEWAGLSIDLRALKTLLPQVRDLDSEIGGLIAVQRDAARDMAAAVAQIAAAAATMQATSSGYGSPVP